MKKLYNLFMMALFSLFLLGACSSGGEDIPEPEPKPDPDKATVSTPNLTAEANEGTLSLSFTTNKAWTASSDQTWCKLSKSSGSSGTSTITLTLEANTTDQDRTAKITITAGTASATATIKQAKKEVEADKVTLNETNFSVEAAGKTITLTFTANKAWTASADQTWCTLSKTSGEAGSAISITANVGENSTEQERTAKITITAGTASATATIKQAKKKAEGGGEQGGEQGGETGNGSSIEDMENKKW